MTQLFSTLNVIKKATYAFITQEAHSTPRPERLPTPIILLIAAAFITIQVCSAIAVTGSYHYQIPTSSLSSTD